MAEQEWIKQVRARGWGAAFSTALDVLEPLGPLGAQLLWIAQPAARLIGGWELVGGLAQALEEPGGVDRLREQLEQDEETITSPPTPSHEGVRPIKRRGGEKRAIWGRAGRPLQPLTPDPSPTQGGRPNKFGERGEKRAVGGRRATSPPDPLSIA